MDLDKKKLREYVEAVPGPAIVISKETYKKMQENNNAKENGERLKKYAGFFERVNNESEILDEDEQVL